MGLLLLCLGAALGSCSGFSAAVSDHWPHWAGGEPNDIPPRPGAPGYSEFIAHKPPDADAAKTADTAGAPNPQAAASGNPPPSKPSAAAGGLY